MNKFNPIMIKKILIFSFCFFLVETVESAILSWDANKKENDLAGYRVHWGIEPGNYHESIDIGNETHWEFNFDPGIYYFAVTAYDFSDNESSFSREVIWVEKNIPTDSSDNVEMVIYPNPFYSILEINAVGTVEIFNMLGQSIRKIEVDGRRYLDLSYLPVGVYFFVCKNRIMKRMKL